MKYRESKRKGSNNTENPNKNICALVVAKFLGVENNIRYLHNMNDLLRASRMKFNVRSRLSKLPKPTSVGFARKRLSALTEKGIRECSCLYDSG